MSTASPATLHTVFTSECNNVQFDWFATGVFESFKTSGMRGKITRLLACSEEELKRYTGMGIGKGIGATFVHPNYRHNPINGDTSASYNKPSSVMHFSRDSNFTEEYLLFIDADMLLLSDIDPVALGAKPGTVVSEEVGYMIGTHNEMASNFLAPEAVPLAKPVGWYHIFHRDDIVRIAPLWLEFCGKVRTMPWLYWAINGSIPRDIPTGDAYVDRGKAPWISEMYGYAFGAATAGVQHVMTHGIVMYPGNTGGSKQPHILHYGIDFNIGSNYNWNKMVYKKLDISKCQGRFFGPPPKPRNRREENCAYVVNTLNTAFCNYYSTHCAEPVSCPPSEQPPGGGLVKCRSEPCCEDKQTACWAWAIDEQCEQNPGFMRSTCPRSCNLCQDAALTKHTAGAGSSTGAARDAVHATRARAPPSPPPWHLLPSPWPPSPPSPLRTTEKSSPSPPPLVPPPPAAASAGRSALVNAAEAGATSSVGNTGHAAQTDTLAPSNASPVLAGEVGEFAPVHVHAHDAPALDGIDLGGVAPRVGTVVHPAHAPSHIAPQMIGRAQARDSFRHAPGSSPYRAPSGQAPATHGHQLHQLLEPVRGAGDMPAALAVSEGDEGTAKMAQQRRLMTLQVSFWVVIVGLFFGRFIVCRRRPRRKGVPSSTPKQV